MDSLQINKNLHFPYFETLSFFENIFRGCRGRDCMVVGFTTTYAISAYHH